MYIKGYERDFFLFLGVAANRLKNLKVWQSE